MDSTFQSLPMRLRSTQSNILAETIQILVHQTLEDHSEPELYILYLKQKNPFLPVLTHTFITKKSDMKKKEQENLCVSAMGRGRDGGREKVVGMLFLVFY